jgi:hypothetical protein
MRAESRIGLIDNSLKTNFSLFFLRSLRSFAAIPSSVLFCGQSFLGYVSGYGPESDDGGVG